MCVFGTVGVSLPVGSARSAAFCIESSALARFFWDLSRQSVHQSVRVDGLEASNTVAVTVAVAAPLRKLDGASQAKHPARAGRIDGRVAVVGWNSP